MRVVEIQYPGDGTAVIMIKCSCGVRFAFPVVVDRKFAECPGCDRVELVHELAERYHIELVAARIGV